MKLAINTAFPEAQIAEANSLASAFDAIEGGGVFDLVLLDLNMPGTRGFEGLLELRARHPKLPVVIVSAIEEPETIHRARALFLIHGEDDQRKPLAEELSRRGFARVETPGGPETFRIA
jgi:CheY-like chemotaxis protein